MPTIEVNFSSAGMRQLSRELEKYQKRIDSRARTFVSRLADLGIRVGRANRGEYSSYILFKKDIVAENGQVTAIITAFEREQIDKWWFYGENELHGETISPLLMAEFGSGKFADIADAPYMDITGKAGQGTLNIYGHAFDSEGWWWTTLDGETHHSYGEKPTYPVYSAYMEILAQIKTVAKEVFK